MGSRDAIIDPSPVEYKARSAPFLGPGLNAFEKQCWRAQVLSWDRLVQRADSSANGDMKHKAKKISPELRKSVNSLAAIQPSPSPTSSSSDYYHSSSSHVCIPASDFYAHI